MGSSPIGATLCEGFEGRIMLTPRRLMGPNRLTCGVSVKGTSSSSSVYPNDSPVCGSCETSPLRSSLLLLTLMTFDVVVEAVEVKEQTDRAVQME